MPDGEQEAGRVGGARSVVGDDGRQLVPGVGVAVDEHDRAPTERGDRLGGQPRSDDEEAVEVGVAGERRDADRLVVVVDGQQPQPDVPLPGGAEVVHRRHDPAVRRVGAAVGALGDEHADGPLGRRDRSRADVVAEVGGGLDDAAPGRLGHARSPAQRQ